VWIRLEHTRTRADSPSVKFMLLAYHDKEDGKDFFEANDYGISTQIGKVHIVLFVH
jgi:hypothetical protein